MEEVVTATMVPTAEEAYGKEPISSEETAQTGRILSALQRHTAGVNIVDLGNELGVDWRSLIAPLQSLQEERKIERIYTMYYPEEKAGEGEL